MPRDINQPTRTDSWKMRSVEEMTPANAAPRRPTDDWRSRAQAETVPASAITRIDVPFEDVFVFALKYFAAQVLIGLICAPVVLVIYLAFLR